ncbi:MAG: hypothetical protein EB127_26985, partial [Alphaproteobacteria bacterium]|nr:hypothetical protein [Alphaproteobacteria bacterium]
TFHDFADARNTIGEGASLKLGVKGSVRARYVIDNVINAMDPINFREIHTTIRGESTFEKSMYATFTDLLDNPLFPTLMPKYVGQIKGHLSKIHSIPEDHSFQNIEIKDGDKYFSSSVASAGGGAAAPAAASAPLPNSSIIELRIPARVYSDEWQKNFIKFLHTLFSKCVTGGRLNIVEDTATFPRELFTSNPENFASFQKLDIPQTRWDPAGLTHFNDKKMENLLRPNINVSAPSFRSVQPFSTNPDAPYPKTSAYFLQSAGKGSLILPDVGGQQETIKNLQRGPSVNHLFMHLIVHSDLTAICQGLGATNADAMAAKSKEIKRDAKRLINAANNPLSGAKNTTLKLVQPAAGQVSNPALLRKYTTSKRTGDYENTNGAKYHNAVLFCGDEPEFVYAMLNEQPAIYHTHDAAGHKFRINASKSFGLTIAQQEEREKEQTVINYIHKAFELTRLFTNVKQ